MQYEKPEMVAQNAMGGSFSAGCPVNDAGTDMRCHDCERTK